MSKLVKFSAFTRVLIVSENDTTPEKTRETIENQPNKATIQICLTEMYTSLALLCPSFKWKVYIPPVI